MHHLWREYGRKSLRMYYTDYQMSSWVQLDPSEEYYRGILEKWGPRPGAHRWDPGPQYGQVGPGPRAL